MWIPLSWLSFVSWKLLEVLAVVTKPGKFYKTWSLSTRRIILRKVSSSQGSSICTICALQTIAYLKKNCSHDRPHPFVCLWQQFPGRWQCLVPAKSVYHINIPTDGSKVSWRIGVCDVQRCFMCQQRPWTLHCPNVFLSFSIQPTIPTRFIWFNT